MAQTVAIYRSKLRTLKSDQLKFLLEDEASVRVNITLVRRMLKISFQECPMADCEIVKIS